MADPNPNTGGPGATPPPGDRPPRRSATPLLWLLVLLVLIAFGWFIYSQRAGRSVAPGALPPPAIDIGDERDAAAERERAADDARRRAREREAAAADTAPPSVPDAGPELLNRIQPVYPSTAYRNREEGTVLLAILVDAEGRAAEVDVVSSSRSRDLDRAAIEAAKQWTFEPAVRDGRKVEARVEAPVTFRLEADR